MSIVGSGSLYLRGQEDNKSIAFEMYENITGSNISLHELSELASLTGSPELGQGMSEFYGFQNQAPPETVTTSAVTSVSSGAATFNGSVTVASGGVTARGFKWMSGNQSVATLISSGTQTVNGSGIGSFTHAQSGLATSTGYSYVAWAENEAGRTYAGVRTYFATLARYTFTFTQNDTFTSPGQAGVGGTRTSTVDQGQTATVDYSVGSNIGGCFTNSINLCNACIVGPYNTTSIYPTGQTFGYYVQRASMNSDSSACTSQNFTNASLSFVYDEPTSTFTHCVSSTWACMRWNTYYNAPSTKDDRLDESFWFLRNGNPESTGGDCFDVSFNCGWEIPDTNPGYCYRDCQSFNVRPGQSYVMGVHTRYGLRPGIGFSYSGISFGPFSV